MPVGRACRFAVHPATDSLLGGADDPIIPLVNAHIMAKLLPHARLHVYADGHLGLVTMADELGPLVGDFLGVI